MQATSSVGEIHHCRGEKAYGIITKGGRSAREHERGEVGPRLGTDQPQPVAAIDAGSNTIHLAVAQVGADGDSLRLLADTTDMVRLGADVTQFGVIGAERAQRAIEAIRRQLAMARGAGATVTLGIATEGVRRALNAEDFIERVYAETGLRFSLITGEQEASLAYWGAISESAAAGGSCGVIDLGGGSLELTVGEGSQIHWRASTPLGAGVIRSRLLPTEPPTFTELIGAYDEIRADLAVLEAPMTADEFIVCGGTATALATLAGRAFHQHAERRSPSRGGSSAAGGRRRVLTGAALDALIRLLLTTDTDTLIRRYSIKEGRAPLMLSGAITLFACMERFDAERLWISRRGIREGAMLAWRHTGDDWLEAATLGRM